MTESDIRVHMHPDFEGEVWQEAIQRLQDYISDEQAEFLHRGRNAIVKARIADHDVVIKYFRNHTFSKKLSYKYRSSKAVRSFEHSLQLTEAGLNTPQPICWREDWKGAWLHDSYYVCAYQPVAHKAWALKDESIPDHNRWIALLGSEIAKMHEAGIHHQDLTPGNALFVTAGDDAYNVYFIDCNRMCFGKVSQGLGIRALVTMGLEGPHIEPYVTAYAETRSYDVDWCLKRYKQLLKRHHFKWAIKNKTRPWRRKIGL